MSQNRPVFRRKACTNPHKTLVFRYIYSFFLFEFVLYLYFTVSNVLKKSAPLADEDIISSLLAVVNIKFIFYSFSFLIISA